MYDILIVGGGPAGLMAGIYAKRAGRSVAIIEKFVTGGQLNLIGEVENYLGFAKIQGPMLAEKFSSHAKSLNVPVIYDEIVDYDISGQTKTLTGKKGTYEAKAVILAQGCHSKELNIEGETKFKGNGVSYCAVCDGNFFKGKDVAVVGSGDSAFSDALYLSAICKHVYVLAKSNLKLHNYAKNEFDGKDNITLKMGALSQRITGEDKLTGIVFDENGKENSLAVDGVFVAIGRTPDTAPLKGKLNMNEKGYIEANEKMETSVPGVFVCGDVRQGSIAQISTAVGDGAIAGTEASKYVLILNAKNK